MRRHIVWQILLLLALLAPLLVLLLMPGYTWMHSGMWLWLILLILVWMFFILAAPVEQAGEDADSAVDVGPSMIFPDEQPAAVREVMDVRVAMHEGDVAVFRGRLRESGDDAFRELKEKLPPNVVPLVQADEQLGTAIILMPRQVEQAAMERPVRPWLHWLLFGLTFLTTTWAGAMHQGINLLDEPEQFAVGLPYSVGLLLILGLHELGHYFTARRHGMRVTPPFFIPVPFALGTFGAFIQMKSPPEDRRVLFDVAVAGPLAGLVVAVPALIIGLPQSEVIVGPVEPAQHALHGTSATSSLLFALITKLTIGQELQYGHILKLSPLAFAGWLGLLVTALNLLPIGQLDGGHMARAMFGTRVGSTISSIAMWSLLLLAIFVWPALLFFAILVFFIAGRGTPPLNDMSPITPGRKALGYVTFLILALILIPLPHAFWQAAGIHCPYV